MKTRTTSKSKPLSSQTTIPAQPVPSSAGTWKPRRTWRGGGIVDRSIRQGRFLSGFRHIGIFSVQMTMHSTARAFPFSRSCFYFVVFLGVGALGTWERVDRGVLGNKGILRYHGKNTPLELLNFIEPYHPSEVLKLAVLTFDQCLRSPWTSWTEDVASLQV